MSLAAASMITIALNDARATDWHEAQLLQQAIFNADRRGDFEGAARNADKCVTMTTGGSDGSPGSYYCTYYLSSALRTGKGIPRDENRAFTLLRSLTPTDHDGDAALALAECYLDGVGTPRDPIEAGIVLWRVKHGAWSIYSDYWGMCDNCEQLWAHEKAVEKRIEQELTAEERTRADNLAAARFPEIAERVTHRDVQIEAAALAAVATVGSLIGWCQWSRKRSKRRIA
jgi:hypothetical protein